MGAVPAFPIEQAAALQGVWMADALASVGATVASTGYAALDAELPGAGWPLGALIEVLQPSLATSVWPLLLPALARQAQVGRLALIQPPYEPYLPALAAAGVPWAQTLWIHGATPAQAAWAGEQALRCQDVAAVVAWLPRAQAGDLRRLHQAAASTGALLFVVRPAQAVQMASHARVRLQVTAAVPPSSGPRLRLVGAHLASEDDGASWPQLRVDLLKRRGPPLPTPLWLPACGEAMLSLLRASSSQQDAIRQASGLASQKRVDGAEHEDLQCATHAPAVHRLLPRRLRTLSVASQRLSVQEGGHALVGAAMAAA